MKNTIFTGAGVAIITPFNEDLSVNYDSLKEILEYQIANGTDAIVITGTTGESATLSTQEHIDVIKFTVDVVNHRIPVIAGTGSNETSIALELSQAAEEAGADALLIVTPYYNKTSQRGLIQHYSYLADRVNLPIIVYNVPSRTGVNVLPETFKKLSEHKNIVAVKEASGNLSQIAQIAALCGDNLDIYSGNDDQIVPIMSLGGKGVISVLSNICPKVAHDIPALYLEGKCKESAELQLKYLELCNAMFMDVNPIPVKVAMNMMGIPAGPLRMPLCEMDAVHNSMLRSVLEKYKII
ncbi:MAG: 4-hydroxy-tetrahydrodipicolinate synthase [Clostridiales bacterium]|nr:4-hydroxy-tetrahydrodipicolinate synthase [Clostridiales bacterium]